MGATLNSSSSAAREMDMVLKSEIAAHAAYDPNSRSSFHGVPVPGKKKVVTKKINRDIDWKSNYLVFSPAFRDLIHPQRVKAMKQNLLNPKP